MEVSEKIIRFTSFEELTSAIKADVSTRDFLAQRYGVRFIMLNNFDTLRRLVLQLQEMDVDMVSLDSLISADEPDGWISTDSLKELVFSCKKTSLITPFSELVRFYPDDQFRGFFSEIILSERCKGSRIYIPIIGLENRFTDFLSHFGRLSESAPIWQYNDPIGQPVEVFVIKKYKNLNPSVVGKRCHLRTLAEWLSFWKDAPKERIICSSLPINVNYVHARPDNIFKFTPITNAHDYITQFMDINLDFIPNKEDETYMDILLEDVVKSGKEEFDIWNYVRERFNKARLTPDAALEVWGQDYRTAYDRWLLKKYLENTPELVGHEYLHLCLSDCSDLDKPYSLFTKLAQHIFYVLPDASKYHDERERVMRKLSAQFVQNVPLSQQEWIQTHIVELGKQSTDSAVYFCTGTFDFEKECLMWVYAHHKGEECSRKALNLYPELSYYLEKTIPIEYAGKQEWAYDYAEKYKQAKIADILTDDVKAVVKEKNANKDTFYHWYFDFTNTKERMQVLAKSPSLKPDKIYWLDGLGIEYFSLIRKLVESDGQFHIVHSEFTRANLPSETTLNGFYDEGVIKYDGIDKLGHDNAQYKPCATLVREIDMVKEYVKRIISDNRGAPVTIAIVSDHGMSALSRKAESRKLEGKYDHEGRFLRVEKGKFADDDFFFTHPNENDNNYYRVALTHSSLSKKPTHEVHGGATPEEVIVPLIIISNKSESVKLDYEVIPTQGKVALSEALVEVTIIPQPTAAFMRFNNIDYELKRNHTQWSVKVEGVKEGKNTFVVIPEAGEPKQIEIEFYGLGAGNIDDEFDL